MGSTGKDDDGRRAVPESRVLPARYVAWPLALARLQQRLGATPHEVAAWVFVGLPVQTGAGRPRGEALVQPGAGELRAYLQAREITPPPRFQFPAFEPGDGAAALDYVAALAACWFNADDLERFQPAERYLLGSNLIARWRRVPELDVETFIQAKIAESRLTDLHPITGGTRGSCPADASLPPLASGLFAISEVLAVEREDFPPGWLPASAGAEPGHGGPLASVPQPPQAVESPEQRRERLREAVAKEKRRGTRDFLQQVARREGISASRLKQLVGPRRTPPRPTPAAWTDPVSVRDRPVPSKKKH